MVTEMESDVIVIGFGGAGATAAITAHDCGASVIILEKMPEGGGNTRFSAGVMIDPGGVEAVDYISTLCFGTTDRDVVENFVHGALENKEWIKAMGGETENLVPSLEIFYPVAPVPCWKTIPGGERMSAYNVKRSEGKRGAREWFGANLWRLLSTNVEQRGINVLTDTPARELMTNEKGEVVGVIAERKGESISIRAKRAVVMTCGGFEYNEAMKQAFLPAGPFYALGNPGNTGDGIVMAQKVGAALWHMTSISAPLGFKVPEHDAAFDIMMCSEKFLYVDRDGKRFANETRLELHDMWRAVSWFDPDTASYPRMPTYCIFDDATRRRGPLAQKMGVNRDHEWSLDNSKEIAMRWISQGKTIRQLAKEISVSESVLDDTVNKYNQFCANGRDTDFGRSKESLGPIDKPPYYAIKLLPCLLNTQGGARRDRDAKVLDYQRKPIPRLYSAGEFGSLWGTLYETAGNLTECLAFGRIAGRNAANEEPW